MSGRVAVMPCILVALGMAGPDGTGSPARAQEKDAKADRAKKAVVQFCARLATDDGEEVRKAIGAPFCHNLFVEDEGRKDRVTAVRAPADLEKFIKKLLERSKDKQFPVADTEVVEAAKFLKQVTHKEERAVFEEVLGTDGYVVTVKLAMNDNRNKRPDFLGERILVLVAFTKGDVRIVGILD